ncbi:MAG TPA: TonB-dependent receptor [Nitrospiraceae bacterium]|nr:TonB-dependent receptor [Nitrospiraceae bacterium]
MIASSDSGYVSRRGSGKGWRPFIPFWLPGVIVTAFLAPGVPPAHSQAMPVPESDSSGVRAIEFDIPPQPLAPALHAFAETTDLQVSYPSEMAANRRSRGVRGTYTPTAALDVLLSGTGLTYTFVNHGTITLQRAEQVGQNIPPEGGALESRSTIRQGRGEGTEFEPIHVEDIIVRETKEQGYKTAEEVSAPTRLPAPVRDIPQSVEVITRKLMDDQRAVRIQDVIRNVSGAFVSATGGGRQEIINLRGFVSGQNIFKNGFRDDITFANRVFRETANLQRVEILKGPASFLYGRSDPSGIMNLVTKKPLMDPYYSAEMIVGSYNLYRPIVDISGPLNESKSLQHRFIGLYESAGSFREGVKSDRIFLAPSFRWTLGSKTSLLFEGEYLHDDRVIDRGLTAIGRGVAPVPISTFLGDPNRRTEFNQGKATLVLLHELSSNWTWRTGFRAAAANEGYDSIEQRGNGSAANGNQTLQLSRQPTVGQSYYLQNEVIGVFTLGFEQRLLAGVEIGRELLTQTITSQPFGTTNVFNPTRVFAPTGLVSTQFDGDLRSKFLAPYIVDQVALLRNLTLTLGGRFDIFEQEQVDRGTSTSVAQNFFSPMVGLTYQPVKPVSLYANYSRSFTPQLGAITRSGDIIRPATGTQYEAGIKLEPLEGRLFTNLAVFQIKQRNLATFDPSDPTFRFSLPTGERRSQGVELDVAGRLMPGWDVIATYAYIDAEILAGDTPLGIASGNTMANVPLHSGSLWTTYTVQSGPFQNVGVGIGAYAAAKRLGDLQNSYEMPGYVRTDAALYYRKPEVFRRTNLTASLNFRNLLDTQYYEGSRENRREIYAGVPFTVLGAVRLEYY